MKRGPYEDTIRRHGIIDEGDSSLPPSNLPKTMARAGVGLSAEDDAQVTHVPTLHGLHGLSVANLTTPVWTN